MALRKTVVPCTTKKIPTETSMSDQGERLTTFELFENIPPELQIMIWRIAHARLF